MAPTERSGSANPPDDYVLGTDDVEVSRLGLQHRIWRDHMLEGWRRAGLRAGMSVVDVGAGPGYATLDLADRVGPSGRVLALERSARFTTVLRDQIARRNLSNVGVREIDLLSDDVLELDGLEGFDMAWCRWIACFLPTLENYARLLAKMVRPGGRVITHEYVQYRTFQCVPAWPEHEDFIAEVLANWHAGGGRPDVADPLTALLRAEGFDVVSMRPLVFVTAPGDEMWEWPSSFIHSHPHRLRELRRVTDAWVEKITTSFARFEADPQTRMVTPMVLEIIAERRSH